MIILGRADVQELLTSVDVIALQREAFLALENNPGLLAPRVLLDGGADSTVFSYLAKASIDGPVVAKIGSVHPPVDGRSVDAYLFVMDPVTGEGLALLDGEEITAARTPAATVAAVEALGLRPSVVAIIGAGTQGRGHAQWFGARFPGCEIRVWSPSTTRADATVESLRAIGVRANAPGNRKALLHGADVIVTATTSNVPVLVADDVEPGALIAGVGSFAPDRQEIGADLLLRARAIVVDDIGTATRQSGPLVANGSLTDGRLVSLGAVMSGAEIPAPEPDRDLMLFLSVGLGIQDAAIAVPLVERARRSGARRVELPR